MLCVYVLIFLSSHKIFRIVGCIVVDLHLKQNRKECAYCDQTANEYTLYSVYIKLRIINIFKTLCHNLDLFGAISKLIREKKSIHSTPFVQITSFPFLCECELTLNLCCCCFCSVRSTSTTQKVDICLHTDSHSALANSLASGSIR